MSREIPLSKKSKREVSAFIGNGLLLDYIQGKLDRERKTAIDNYLLYSRDAQLEKEKIEKAMECCLHLQGLVIQPQLLQKIESQQNYIQVFLHKSKLKQLPAGIRWGIEAIGAMILILMLLVFTPWQTIIHKTIQKQQESVILAEVNLIKNNLDNQVDHSNGEFVDEEMNLSKKIVSTQVEPDSKKLDTSNLDLNKPEVIHKNQLKESQTNQAQVETHANQTGKNDIQKTEGFLYRGEVKLTNINASGAKITAKIGELGGRKAGEVNLGWKRNTTSLYYHFTIPETKYKDLLAFLSSYGKINMMKEKHPRLMPEGIVRVILNVDEAQK